MTANQHKEYNGQFPENFNWSMLDSRYLSQLASDLAFQIKKELSQPPGNRINVAGLRFALTRIAGMSQLSIDVR